MLIQLIAAKLLLFLPGFLTAEKKKTIEWRMSILQLLSVRTVFCHSGDVWTLEKLHDRKNAIKSRSDANIYFCAHIVHHTPPSTNQHEQMAVVAIHNSHAVSRICT